MLLFPVCVCIVANTLIYLHVRASTRRARSRSAPRARHRRDIFLLRHMIFLCCVYMLGWGPSMIVDIVIYHSGGSGLVYDCVTVNFQLALLVDIIDLFLYNREVRKYLTGLCLPRYRG